MSNKYVSSETWPVDFNLQEDTSYQILRSGSLGHTLFVHAVCFLLFNNGKSFENAAKSLFSIKRMRKTKLIQLSSVQ